VSEVIPLSDEITIFDENNAWLRAFLMQRYCETTSVRERHQIIATLGSLKTFVETTDTTTPEYRIHEDSRNYFLALYAPDRFQAEIDQAESADGPPFISL
jgi:hypothetical protein